MDIIFKKIFKTSNNSTLLKEMGEATKNIRKIILKIISILIKKMRKEK